VNALEQQLKAEKLEGITSDPLVTKFGREGELATSQQGLVATVVAMMQDRLILDLRKHNSYLRASMERQSFVSAFFSMQTAVALKSLHY
jgi:hypothetical protein